MKTLIIAINSKYIHSALAPWYFKAYCEGGCGEIKILEFTINDNIDSVLSAIYTKKADIAAFSCYIWNIAYVLKLVESLKDVSPGITVILGGPEVSFDSGEFIEKNPLIDYIIQGEGETVFKHILMKIQEYRETKKLAAVISGKPIENLDLIPSPYTNEMISRLGNRIVYYESSRGCPFSCSYCLSSTFAGVRYFSMRRVGQDLQKLIDAGVRQVKFVDRTFNCNRHRAMDIFQFIISKAEKGIINGINFHFEAAADLFDDEMLDLLEKASPGLIQFEIGIQTTNMKTTEAINRKTDIVKAFSNIKQLICMGNIHIHLDLIAGLPYEDIESFKNSFNMVYALAPHHLQLGFLKLLRGTRIRKEDGLHGYRYRKYPPYEVLCNDYVSFDDMVVLKGIEELLERYYNSGRFVKTLDFSINKYFKSPFDFFHQFYLYCKGKEYLNRPMPSRNLYTVFLNFIKNKVDENGISILNELLKLDFLASDSSGNLPEGIVRTFPAVSKEQRFDFLKDERNVKRYLDGLAGVPVKKAYNQVHFEVFNCNKDLVFLSNGTERTNTVLLFNYVQRDPVTGLFKYYIVDV